MNRYFLIKPFHPFGPDTEFNKGNVTQAILARWARKQPRLIGTHIGIIGEKPKLEKPKEVKAPIAGEIEIKLKAKKASQPKAKKSKTPKK